MHTRLLAIGFLASPGWGRWKYVWTLARVRFNEMRLAAQSRRFLAGMDARTLRDIGLSRADAQAEAARWPWDLGPTQR